MTAAHQLMRPIRIHKVVILPAPPARPAPAGNNIQSCIRSIVILCRVLGMRRIDVRLNLHAGGTVTDGLYTERSYSPTAKQHVPLHITSVCIIVDYILSVLVVRAWGSEFTD